MCEKKKRVFSNNAKKIEEKKGVWMVSKRKTNKKKTKILETYQ